MENKVRGEVILKADSKSFVLCLSLGALAEIEATLGVKDLSEIGALMSKPNATQIAQLVVALIHGGASDETEARRKQYEVTIEEVMKLPINVKSLTRKLTEAFNSSMDDDIDDDTSDKGEPNPQPNGA